MSSKMDHFSYPPWIVAAPSSLVFIGIEFEKWLAR
jgi:hypothetical protein